MHSTHIPSLVVAMDEMTCVIPLSLPIPKALQQATGWLKSCIRRSGYILPHFKLHVIGYEEA